VAAAALWECSFLIPIRRDAILADGKLHRRAAWAWLEGRLSAFGGATRASGLYPGWYPDPQTGQRVDDRSRKYFVALPRSRVGELRALLREACGVFAQKCIYLSVAGRVEFLEGGGDATA
jgi:hypothetical protein